MEERLLQLCGYGLNDKNRALVKRIRNNYSEFERIVTSLESLQPILAHSYFYLSLQNDRDMICIRNDMADPEAFLMCDAEIIVWANQQGIELEEGFDEISLLGFRREE